MAIGWGQAKREVTALRSEILNKFSQGITTRQIYISLVHEKRITIARASFYRHVKSIREEYATSSAQELSPKSISNNQTQTPQPVPSTGGSPAALVDQLSSSSGVSHSQPKSQNKPHVISDPSKPKTSKPKSTFKFSPVPDKNFFD